MTAAPVPAVIAFRKSGIRPPVYLAGTFSDPPWQPLEMDHALREDGEHDFKKEISGEPGSKIQYKFRIGEDWWVLDENTPTVTDDAGNTNHVLEVKPPTEQVQAQGPNPGPTAEAEGSNSVRPSHPHPERPEPAQDVRQRQGGNSTEPLTYAKVAARHFQPSTEAEAHGRSGTGTPISARVAGEVADSAALLHEGVPARETAGPSASTREQRRRSSGAMSEEATTAAEVADTAEGLDKDQNADAVPDQPRPKGDRLAIPGQGAELIGDEDRYLAHESPLFSHECVGLYDSDEEMEPTGVANDEEENEGEGEVEAGYAAPVEDIDPDKVDLNDPTLERFPSSREDIMDTVRKLKSSIQVDQPVFPGNSRGSVVIPSRRGTEDITGDFLLTPPQPPSPTPRRVSKRSPRGSMGSVAATSSLHSISEAEEAAGEAVAESSESEETGGPAGQAVETPPAVVFSNPDMRRRPAHLKLPAKDEDEGVVIPEGVSPRSLVPAHRSVSKSPPRSPLSPRTMRPSRTAQTSPSSVNSSISSNLAPPDVELSRDKERSMQHVILHPPPKPAESQDDRPGQSADEPPRSSEGAGGAQSSEGTAKDAPTTAGPGKLGKPGAQEAPAPAEPEPEPATRSLDVQAAPKGGWIRAFFRLIFVDLIGGVIGKLLGGWGRA